jgi:phosphotransferase system HPr-like phosphotransfer protein
MAAIIPCESDKSPVKEVPIHKRNNGIHAEESNMIMALVEKVKSEVTVLDLCQNYDPRKC